MAVSVRGDVFNQDIKSVYIDMVCLYELTNDDKRVYTLTQDTVVIPYKNYFKRVGNNYIWEIPTGSPFGYYEERSVYLNSSHNFLFNDRYYSLAAFSVTEPDRTSVNEESGTLTIAGVTSDYVQMLQNVEGKLMLSCALIKYDEIEDGFYILEPIEYEISNITLDSAQAAMSITLKGGGLLNYYASKDDFGTANFPGLH